jgi:hypothetical protein
MCVVSARASVRPSRDASCRPPQAPHRGQRGLPVICYCITTSHLMFLARDPSQDLHHVRLAVRKIRNDKLLFFTARRGSRSLPRDTQRGVGESASRSICSGLTLLLPIGQLFAPLDTQCTDSAAEHAKNVYKLHGACELKLPLSVRSNCL